MRYERYRRIEQAVAASDSGGIWERWRYGRRLLCDAEATTPNGNLQHGVLDKLKRGAARSHRKLSDREIQYRLQCARAYPKESQIRSAAADFESWRELCDAGFPPIQAAGDERPYNPLETDELRQQSDRRGARLIERAGYDESLFDHFEKTATLAEIKIWADEQDEITAIIVAHHSHRCHLRQVFCTERGKKRYLTKHFNINGHGVPPFQDVCHPSCQEQNVV